MQYERKIKVGIIGTGNISTFHMDGYKRLSDRCDVVAVCDIDRKKLRLLQRNTMYRITTPITIKCLGHIN